MSNDNTKASCTCNQKALCCKMQNAALRRALKELSKHKTNSYCSEVRKIFYAIEALLKEYNCIPCEKLINRVNWTIAEIPDKDKELSNDDVVKVRMLIDELEVFLGEETN